jgi:16S rRNA (uracil1498-N3)-methyltransferase
LVQQFLVTEKSPEMALGFNFAPLTFSGPLRISQEIALGTELVVALQSREVNVKEAFSIFDSSGTCFRASLTALGDHSATALIYERFAASPESPLELTLFVAVLARQRMIFVAQKAAELGCARLIPIITAHSVQPGPAMEKEKPWAWQRQGLKGSRQCRRASILEVQTPLRLQAALASDAWASADVRVIQDDRGSDVDGVLGELSHPVRKVALLSGPEGGFSDSERALLDAANPSALRARFGTRVLRAETAVLVGATLMQKRFGDL